MEVVRLELEFRLVSESVDDDCVGRAQKVVSPVWLAEADDCRRFRLSSECLGRYYGEEPTRASER